MLMAIIPSTSSPLVNARNLPDHGLSEVARLAQVAPAYRMSYADFGQIGERLEALGA